MKPVTLFCAMSACTLLSAREIRIGEQSASPFPDAEVSTNVTFRVERKDVQEFGVRIDLECSESNCVQVAFGCDADGDGNLAFDETEFAIGWRSGRAFIENVADGVSHVDESPVSSAGNRFLDMRVVMNQECQPKRVAFANNAGACFADVASECPVWLFNMNWNICKVTRRGTVPAEEVCRINRICRSFHFIIR